MRARTGGVLPDWPRAHGGPLFSGQIRRDPAEFEVVEVLGWEPSGDGEHDFLKIEKTGQNTAWVATQLARHAGVPARDVGYSGLKDRHAVTRQWFSVRRPTGAGTDWNVFRVDGVEVLDVNRHNRKLKRGVHRMNRFRIVVRDADADPEALAGRLAVISSRGIPNYFGPQRFGRDAGNLALAEALFGGRKLRRQQRSIAISAARSFLFNEILSARILNATWDKGMVGDCYCLDGTNSVFEAADADDAVQGRIESMDIHPTGPLWGDGDSRCRGDALQLETRVIAERPRWTDGLSAVKARMARRALRTRVQELRGETGDKRIVLSFVLGAGAYATSVLREIGDIDG